MHNRKYSRQKLWVIRICRRQNTYTEYCNGILAEKISPRGAKKRKTENTWVSVPCTL